MPPDLLARFSVPQIFFWGGLQVRWARGREGGREAGEEESSCSCQLLVGDILKSTPGHMVRLCTTTNHTCQSAQDCLYSMHFIYSTAISLRGAVRLPMLMMGKCPEPDCGCGHATEGQE